MNTPRTFALICIPLLLSGCGMYKQKAAGKYLDLASAAAHKQNFTSADANAAFALVDKAVACAPDSAQAVKVLEQLTSAAVKIGYAKAQDMEAAALKKILEQAPANWAAQAARISLLAAGGDVSGLADAALAAGSMASPKAEKGHGKPHAEVTPEVKYCALLTQLYATAAAVPLLEKAANLDLNKSPADFFEKTSIYSTAVTRVKELNRDINKLAASDPALKTQAPDELASSAGAAVADALHDTEKIKRAADFNARTESYPEFKTAVKLTVQGNAALTAGEYEKARACYEAAVAQYPGMIDARQQLVEVDFKEGTSLAATPQSKKAADALICRAYGSADTVIKDSLFTPNNIPFIKHEEFLGETYSLKAAAIYAMRAVEGKKLKKTALARLESEFKSALDQAMKLNPEDRQARDLFAGYTKAGF